MREISHMYGGKSQSRAHKSGYSRGNRPLARTAPNPSKTPEIGILDPDGVLPNPITGLEYSGDYRDLAKRWSQLPAYGVRYEMIQAMEHNDVLLLESETGSGKTVLAPKYALHYTKYAGNVIVTIPKREITLNAASYAAKTLDVNLGEHVGYAFSGAPKTK